MILTDRQPLASDRARRMLASYKDMPTVHIETTGVSPDEVVRQIVAWTTCQFTWGL